MENPPKITQIATAYYLFCWFIKRENYRKLSSKMDGKQPLYNHSIKIKRLWLSL